MERKRLYFIEICIGLLLVIIGFILWWWSEQLYWICISIYPPPLAKRLIEILPFAFLIVGVLVAIDGVRRMTKHSKLDLE